MAFTGHGLVVTIDLSSENGVARTTAIEAARRTAWTFASWSQPGATSMTPEEKAAFLSESDLGLRPAIKVGVATVKVVQ